MRKTEDETKAYDNATTSEGGKDGLSRMLGERMARDKAGWAGRSQGEKRFEKGRW